MNQLVINRDHRRMTMTLKSPAVIVPKSLVEEVFGRKWQKARPILRYIRALEADRNMLIEHYNGLREEHLALIDEVEARDEQIAELEARLDRILRAARRDEPDEEILLAGL